MKIKIRGLKGYLFESAVEQVLFDGFFKLLNPKFAEANRTKPSISEGKEVVLSELSEEALQTKPPPRFNEASLIRALEEKGIGRPSTYAPILSLIQEKNYVEKDGRYFIPTGLGTAVCDYLSSSFPEIFNLEFTAKMEESLDEVAEDKKDFIQLLKDFFGPFKIQLEEKKKDVTPIEVEDVSVGVCPDCGSNLVNRFSRFGKFIACSNYPKCRYTKSILKTVKGKKCPKCKGAIVVRYTKNKKRFYGCSNYPKCDFSAWSFKEIK